MYTSGTTGPPKGVLISRRAIAADIDALAEAWAVDARRHPGARSAAVPRARAGARSARLAADRKSLRAHRKTDAGGLRRGRRARCTSGCRRCGRGSPATSTRRWRCRRPGCWCRAARALPVPVFDRLVAADRPRTRRAVRQHRIADHAEHPRRRRASARLGRAAAGGRADPAGRTRTVRRCRTTGKPLGALQVQGPTLFDGYLNLPEATAEAFDADGWYRTGDVAVIDGDGMHRIVGRESVDLIKSGGYRVGAGEIETVLLGHPGVAEVGGGRCARRRPRPADRRVRRRRRRARGVDRLCRRTAFGAQAAPRGARSSTACRATRWARC